MLSTDSESNETSLTLFFNFKQLEIKCEFLKNHLKLYYSIETDVFKYIGSIQSEDDQFKSMTVLSESRNECFLFVLLLNETTATSSPGLNCGYYIKNSLYRTLFQNCCKNSILPPNLMIATHDGFLYSLPLNDNAPEADSLLKTLSPIIYLDVFIIKDQISSLFEPQQKQNKDVNGRAMKVYNSIFLVTSHGELFVYCYLNAYKFLIHTLTHDRIRTCIKFNDELFYCTNENEVFYFNLNNLISEPMIEVKHLKNLKVSQFYEKDSKLFAKTFSGRSIQISELRRIGNEETNKNPIILDNNSREAKLLMNKFQSLSTKMVELQCDLDRIDKTLNQMQILKKHEIKDADLDEKSDELFEIDLKLKTIDSHMFYEICLKNKNLILDDDVTSNNRQNSHSSFMVLFRIKVKCNHINDYLWLHKKSEFNALKPAQSQIFLVDVNNLIENSYIPIQLTIFLIYNISHSSLSNCDFDDSYLKNDEFKVCVYNSKIELNSNLLRKGVDIDNFPNVSNALQLDYLKTQMPWKQIKLESLDKILLSNSLGNETVKSQSKKSEIYYDSFSRISYKLDLVDKFNCNLTVKLVNDGDIMNLIRFKNDFVLKEILSTNDQLDGYLKNLERNYLIFEIKKLSEEIKNSFKSGSKEIETRKQFIQASFKLLNIYSKLRSIFYSTLSFYKNENVEMIDEI